ncbi:MAG: carboxy terminal-processing peptidase [Bacteroidales bacterium]
MLDVGEKEMDYVMPWSKVDPLDYKPWEFQYNLKELQKKSNKRVRKSHVFDLIEEDAKRVEKNRMITSRTLQLDEFNKRQDELQKASEELNEAIDQSTPLTVIQLKKDSFEYSQDTVKMDRFVNWKKDLQKDVYLEETLYIIEDTKLKARKED